MDYPRPLIFEPLELPHQQTFILLHGRGSWADKFGPELLQTAIQNSDQSSLNHHKDEPLFDKPAHTSQTQKPAVATLQTAFPHARFIFPTAARRRATIYKRARTRQWFDNWKLDPPATDREELQIDGLRETIEYLHQLLRTEIALVPGGARNLVFGGLSQGCAASLIALLLWEGEDLGAFVGMCGWLPFAERLMAEICGEEDGQNNDDGDLDFNPFTVDGDDEISDGKVTTAAGRAVGWLRDELDLPSLALPSRVITASQAPIFLGHGVQDDKVSIALGRRASECLSVCGARVIWNEYDGLGHWYSSKMLKEMVHHLGNLFTPE
ncbi:hypothetical protein Daus18300_010105 [Diaporthe australafricana]|uniref:Phospholipase/carboxylesterase/thioesterase domain-containing protein n=1 Tax=Diaporthe australafricana TaxID=127596 RepID=A0ABR3WBR9_9PEZI